MKKGIGVKMRNILIVDCASTGLNYIEDIVRRNYNPVILELDFDGDSEFSDSFNDIHRRAYELIDQPFELINEGDSYEETLDMVREIDPLLILSGSEDGVILAEKLSHDLDLPSNPIESLDSRTLKGEMQNALVDAGLRSIRGRVVHSAEEAARYYEKSGFGEVVVKPVRNAGSFGVKICTSRDEVFDAVSENINSSGVHGNSGMGYIVQEKITGTEYIVNTVSCNGVHRVTTIWRYHKTRTREGAYIYDYAETVNELDISHAEMIEYAYDVADAVGVKIGAIHGEYMIDENGPVLIEVNCRPMGASMPAEFLDRTSGQHETDSILDAYLDEERFNRERSKPYRLYSHAVLKFFIVPSAILGTSVPMEHIAKRLPSHYKSVMPNVENPVYFPKTYDLDTAGGMIYLNHEDKTVLQKDVDYLCSVEQHAFSQVISSGLEKVRERIDEPDLIRNLLVEQESRLSGTILLVTEEEMDMDRIVQCSLDDLDDVPSDFDTVLIDLSYSIINKDDAEISRLMLDIISKVKIGGVVAIPQKTYQCIVGGRNGMEAIVKALNLRIEVPPCELRNTILASRTL